MFFDYYYCYYYYYYYYYYCLVFVAVVIFVNYGDMLMQIVIFVFSFFVLFYLNLVGINQKYMLLTLLTYLLGQKQQNTFQ